MGRFVNFETFSKKKGEIKTELLRINHSKKSIEGQFKVLTFRDKDTRQIVCYIPSLEISGYGATDKKAKEMLKFSLDACFKHFVDLSQKKLEIEIRSLGWLKKPLRNKEYSKSFVDIDGNLQSFNAVDDKVEEAILTV